MESCSDKRSSDHCDIIARVAFTWVVSRVDLIVADGDQAVPPSSSGDAIEHLRNGYLHPIKSLGHLAHEEDPDQIFALIERCLQAA